MKKLIFSLLMALMSCQPAFAQVIPSIPYNLTNGSLADATQVMGNFNTIVSDTNANAATNGANTNITSLSGLTTPLANTYGGTALYTGGTTGGSANAQTLSAVVPSNFALTAGNIVTGIAGFTNSGALTLSVNSGAATAVEVEDNTGVHALLGGEVFLGNSYSWYYDGTEFVLLNPSIITSGNIPSSATLAGSPTTTTQSSSDNSTKIATTAQVASAIAAIPVAVPAFNSIAGFLPSSITGSHTTATLTVSAGQASDSGNTVYISNASTESWAVNKGNAINGYSGGTTLPNSSTIHMYECSGGSGVGSYAIPNSSYPLAAASCPTGYAVSDRRVFSFNTDSSGNPLPYTAIEIGGGATANYLATQLQDIASTSLASSSRTLFTLTVPTGIKVSPLVRTYGNENDNTYILTSGDETDVAATAYNGTGAPGYDSGSDANVGSATPFLTTNTSGQIGIRGQTGSSSSIYGSTRGYIDFRRN